MHFVKEDVRHGPNRSQRIARHALFGSFAIMALGLSATASAGSTCPEGMWSTHGSCCEPGNEYVSSKNQCLPLRPERRCVEGHLDDCVVAGRQLEQRGSVGAGYASELYRYACDEGHAPACRGLGALHEKGLGVEADQVKAHTLYVQACDGGDAPACTLLAEQMLGDETTTTRALTLFAQACHRGDALACNEYGEQLAHRPESTKQSALYFERACVGGVGSACRTLLIKEHDSSPERVRELLDRGCRASDAESCLQLGDVYRGGLVPESKPQAALRYGAACDLHNFSGCIKLAELTAVGDGVARDLSRASELYGRACDGGVKLACERATSLNAQRPRAPLSQAAH